MERPLYARFVQAICNPYNAIIIFALALRLVVVAVVLLLYPSGWLYTRGTEMALLARSLLGGQGLSSPFGPSTGPTAFIAPGYPLLVAGVFSLFGDASTASAFCIMAGQTLANLVTIGLMMHVCRMIFGERAALIAGAVWAVSLPLIWMPTIFWETSLSACSLLGLLAWALHLRRRSTRTSWLLLGACCAVAALFNPALLLSSVAIVGWLVWQIPRNQRCNALLAAFSFVIVFSPWPLRNARTFHAFVPLRTTVGYELWMGNRPQATGYLDESLFLSFNRQELRDYIQRGELGYTQHKSNLAIAYMRGHPAITLRLTALRLLRFWSGTGTRGGSVLFALHALLTSGLGLCGLALLVRNRQHSVAVLFALPLLLFPLPYYLTHAEFRYRLVLDPLLTMLSAYTLTGFSRRRVRDTAMLPPLDEAEQALFV